ncbi:MAG: NADH-quinone oxidoreductase subunit L [Nitrospirae bacterium]|nr:MAG: NADH-quinone oxidoreductase subunit L [Nitrospirota bacterium]
MNYVVWIPALPLGAFLVNILLGRRVLKHQAHWPSVLAVAGSMVLAFKVLADVHAGNTANFDLYTWVLSGDFRVSVGFLIDQLTSVMLIVVTTVSFLVHVYSIGYMHDDPGYYRFYAYLSLFTFSMLMLVTANNFLQLYFGWEAVGLCSYLLIGFWYQKPSASAAGMKAFVVNRFGDFGFGLGVMLVFVTLKTVYYAEAFERIVDVATRTIHLGPVEVNLVTLIALLLFCGAVGKSAQIPLHVWLPDAMEGPTPVSALIHAATMVTAGVFMVARCAPIFNLSPVAMDVVAVVGGVTALFAATIALVQNDIKRVIAYSTISQLGYMFLACGVGAYSAGIFHLYTHAYFKALLFLCAGSVMHAMAGELDIQKMGGLKKYMPITYWTMLVASLSISGIPPLAGFFSKDEILAQAFAAGGTGRFVWFLGTVAALLTAFYSFRVIYLAFHGEFRGTEEQKHHLHESPPVMTVPLIILCIGAVAAGWVGIPEALGGHNAFGQFLHHAIEGKEHHLGHTEEYLIMALSLVVGLTGIVLAYIFYIKDRSIPVKLAERFRFLYKLLWNKYYVDELYGAIIVRPALFVASSIIEGFTDRVVIEGVVNGVPALIGRIGARLRQLQNGVVQNYAQIIGAGVFVILAVLLIKLMS